MNKIYIKKFHIILEILSLVLALAALLVAIVFAAIEDGPVPTHYSFDGKPDAWGSAWGGVILPVIMLLSTAGMSAVIHLTSPDAWNLGIRNIRPSRRTLIISDACTMMAMIEFGMAAFSLAFTLISAFGDGKGLLALTGGLMLMLFVPVVWFFVAANKHNKQ